MKLMARIFAGLGAFLIIDAIIYGFLSYDWQGLTLIVIAAGGGLLIGSYLLQGIQRAEAALDEHPEGTSDVEPHVEPTIWPLVFALSMIGLVVGAVSESVWVLVIGGIVLIAALTGWSLDVRRQWMHHSIHAGEAPGEPPHLSGAHPPKGPATE